METINAIDTAQARQFLNALGDDLHWRLIKADDQHHLKGDPGHWLENSRDPGRLAGELPLDRLDDQYSWHVRPMPKAGPYVLTMLDDASKATLDRMTAEGLPPTAVVATSSGTYQAWHRWPWAFPREKVSQLLPHLQGHYGTDPGANLPGHNGRLPGSRNWKRIPDKGIDRGGCPVSLVATQPFLTRSQATAWFHRYPICKPEPAVVVVPTGQVGQLDFDDRRYQNMLAKHVPLLPAVWHQSYARHKDASRADAAVALRAVTLQLDDATVAGILRPFLNEPGRAKHHESYLHNTIAKVREWADVSAPGVWGPRFDAGKQFPWLKEPSRQR